MGDVKSVALPGAVVAAASDGATVWCVAADRLLGFESDGAQVLDTPAPSGVDSLAVAGETLAAAVAPGVVIWLDGRSGAVAARAPVGGDPTLVAGGGAVWVFDRAAYRARRILEGGALGAVATLPGAAHFAPDGEQVWWTSREDTLLHGDGRTVELGMRSEQIGAVVACGGAIWLSVEGGLLLVGSWAAEIGAPIETPEGPVHHLACAGGILVGASGRHGLFVLDPSADVGVRHVDVDLGGDLGQLVATRSVTWAFPAGAAEARLVLVRPGG